MKKGVFLKLLVESNVMIRNVLYMVVEKKMLCILTAFFFGGGGGGDSLKWLIGFL